MKLPILLPILADGATKRKKKDNQGNRSVERFAASDVTEECLTEFPRLGGTFDAPNEGSYGEALEICTIARSKA